jgi:hypothetical protein
MQADDRGMQRFDSLCERLNALPLHALSARKELMNRAVQWAVERGQFLPAGGEAPQ